MIRVFTGSANSERMEGRWESRQWASWEWASRQWASRRELSEWKGGELSEWRGVEWRGGKSRGGERVEWRWVERWVRLREPTMGQLRVSELTVSELTSELVDERWVRKFESVWAEREGVERRWDSEPSEIVRLLTDSAEWEIESSETRERVRQLVGWECESVSVGLWESVNAE